MLRLFFFLACMTFASSAHALTASDIHETTYGAAERLEFAVYRNGSRVGSHEVAFTRTEDGHLDVFSRFEIDIGILFIPLYEMVHETREIWDDEGLKRLEVYVDENGDTRQYEGVRTDTGFSVQGGDEPYVAPLDTFVTSHWNNGVCERDAVINTLTGNINRVEMIAEGMEEIRAKKGTVEGTHWRYTGDLQTSVWYDDVGRWVGLAFKGPDGSDFEYRCVSCGESSQTGSG